VETSLAAKLPGTAVHHVAHRTGHAYTFAGSIADPAG
jgi:hypothetical protein